MWSVQTHKFRPVIMYCMVLWYFVIAVINSHLNTLRIKQYHRWGALSLPQGLSQGGPLPPVLLWDSQTGPPHFRPSNKGGLCAFKFEPAGGSIGHKHLLWACSLHWGGNRGFGGVHDSIGWHMGGIWCLDLAPRFTASYRVHHFDAMWGLHGAASKWSSYARRHSQIIPTQALVSWWAVCWWQAQSLVRQMGAVGHLGGTASLVALPKPSQTLQPCTFQIIVNPFNIFQHLSTSFNIPNHLCIEPRPWALMELVRCSGESRRSVWLVACVTKLLICGFTKALGRPARARVRASRFQWLRVFLLWTPVVFDRLSVVEF